MLHKHDGVKCCRDTLRLNRCVLQYCTISTASHTILHNNNPLTAITRATQTISRGNMNKLIHTNGLLYRVCCCSIIYISSCSRCTGIHAIPLQCTTPLQGLLHYHTYTHLTDVPHLLLLYCTCLSA
jgi:hypothetical protein